MAAAVVSAAITFAIFIFMVILGYPVLASGRLLSTLLGAWDPIRQSYGVLPMIVGTFVLTVLAVAMAFPVCLGCAALVSGVASKRTGWLLHGVIRMMTAIPTVVYGFVGIFLLVPLLRDIYGRGSGFSLVTAAFMLALLVSPTMILLFCDAFAQVPREYRQAAAALGATTAQQFLFVVLPQAWRGVLAGILLGLGRALGDTMIALMLAGNAIAFPEHLFESARTLTAHIALIIASDFDSPEFRTLFLCGLTLYALTTLLVAAVRITVRLPGRRP
jgi:phosphate transport system permease protein